MEVVPAPTNPSSEISSALIVFRIMISNPSPPPPPPRKVVTPILIAMPAPHHAQSEMQNSAATSEGTLVFEGKFPEVLFGGYEGVWAQHQSSPPPPLGNDVVSRG